MASSDEEGEIGPDHVTNYYFVDNEDKPISFSILPLKWGDNECDPKLEPTEDAFLRGMVENGCRQIYRKVVAWKFELSYVHPEIYVLPNTKYSGWIKLQRPRKSYEDTVRTVLIAVHCLHFMKRNSEKECGEALWKHIRKTFGTYDVPPSENDLVEHMELIREVALRDEDISKNLPIFLSERSGKRKDFGEQTETWKKPKFIEGKDDGGTEDDDLNDEEEDELFDRVCALCDDGGEILCCEGRCIRSFHPTIESGAASSCESLGYTKCQVDAIQTFRCPNCLHHQHQCFICGRLGSSDKSSGAEVFPCVSATCGHFYHPRCVSKLVFPGDENHAQELQEKIEAGYSFTCPAHKCVVCKHGEDKNSPGMQFAICRRCPKAYHRKCLPRNISFQSNDDKNIPQRAWGGLLSKRILIYCMDHKISRKLLTPRRDHLLFPGVDRNEEHHHTELPPENANVMSETRSKAYGILSDEEKPSKRISTNLQIGDSSNNNKKNLAAGKVPKQNFSSSVMVPKNAATSEGRNQNKPSTKFKLKLSGKRVKLGSVMQPPVRAAAGSGSTLKTSEMEHRIRRLMEKSYSSINVEEFLEEQRRKAGHPPPRLKMEKTITLGKVECLVQAIREALKKLGEGGTIEDAKAVCEPAVLTQMVKWKKKLGVYLAPFIHGMRYTSFGRHFTKVDKLNQVVNRLRWYVQDGDTIVDFCCGSNDFSCLMKEELDSMGRKCFFKNYDLIQPKNDFNFERRDWMSIDQEELPEGSKLILGLNPPFGVKAFHANQFIDKALKFQPKLLVLIVPKETERLDRKRTPYDLIWEDDHIFSGKSFYLPGSIDVHEQQMEQWNLEPPPLYLWSRPDWTAKHKAAAVEYGHVKDQQQTVYSGANLVSNYLMEENQDCYADFSSIGNAYNDINRILEDLPDAPDDFLV